MKKKWPNLGRKSELCIFNLPYFHFSLPSTMVTLKTRSLMNTATVKISLIANRRGRASLELLKKLSLQTTVAIWLIWQLLGKAPSVKLIII